MLKSESLITEPTVKHGFEVERNVWKQIGHGFSHLCEHNSQKVLCDVKINGIKASSLTLMDTGSSDCNKVL